jgi:hypothetical protein
MTEFLIELYVPQADAAGADDAARRFVGAAADLTAEGRSIEVVRSIFVPADETCFLLVSATSADDVRETAREASVHFDHLGEASAHHYANPAGTTGA